MGARLQLRGKTLAKRVHDESLLPASSFCLTKQVMAKNPGLREAPVGLGYLK